jgi:hypothetical protein
MLTLGINLHGLLTFLSSALAGLLTLTITR